jgi:hypothetical protein
MKLLKMPLRVKPLMEPLASSSTVPVGEGAKFMRPARLISPLKAEARSMPGMSVVKVENGLEFVSAMRSQG